MSARKTVYVLLFCFFSIKLQCVTVGSNTASSRQLKTFFPASDTNNKMMGFTVFERGLTLEDSSTTCTVDVFFPVSGNIVLNGGNLFLYRDLVFNGPLSIGSGCIEGDGFALLFPDNISSINIPTVNHNKLLSFCDSVDVGGDINCVDWSFDDQYVVVAIDGFAGNELQIYRFEDEELLLTYSKDFEENNLFSARWHPSAYYIAVGISGSGDELYTYSFNVTTTILEELSSENTGNVKAVAWSPDGTKLAVGRNNNDLLVYNCQAGALSSSYTCTLYTGDDLQSIAFQKHGLDWKSSGDYFVASFKITDTNANESYGLKAFFVEENNFTDNAYMENSSKMYPVAYKPSSSLISVGLTNTDEKFRLYEHDGQGATFTEITQARIGESRNVFDISWNNIDNNYVAYTKNSGASNYELQVLNLDSSEYTFSLVTGYNHDDDLDALQWSHGGNYMATGGKDGSLIVLKFAESPLRFKNVKLFFDSDVVLTGNIIFEGDSILHGDRNILELSSDAIITVSSGATLSIEGATIKGISGENIACIDDSCKILLKDVVWIQDGDYAFTKGALQFKSDIKMSGDYIFAYQTVKTSTILSKSTLELDLGFTFSYNPNIYSQNLIYLQDNSSIINLNGATLHTTVTGMQLINGRLRVLRDSFMSSETEVLVDRYLDEGITFGNSNASNDFVCDIYGGVTLHVLQGSLNYKNILSSSWNMGSVNSSMWVYSGARINLYQNLDLGLGDIMFRDNSTLGISCGKNITGSICPCGRLNRLLIGSG
ncbi:WD40 repeat domain-containing protein [Candidatus Dependentiae bacterium]